MPPIEINPDTSLEQVAGLAETRNNDLAVTALFRLALTTVVKSQST